MLKLFVLLSLSFLFFYDAAAQKVRLTWRTHEIGSVEKYRIYRKAGWQDSFYFIGEVRHPIRTYFDNQLFFNTDLYYAVTSVDSLGNESSFSRLAELFIPDEFAPFGEFELVVDRDNVLISWMIRKSDRPWEFQIFRSESSGGKLKLIGIQTYSPELTENRLQFIDRKLASGHYFYQIVTKNQESGKFFSELKEIKITQIGTYFLQQNYPNPFNSSTKIRFGIGEERWVSVKIFNLEGQEIKQIINENLHAGVYEIIWDGSDSRERILPSGTYLVELKSGDVKLVRRILLLK